MNVAPGSLPNSKTPTGRLAAVDGLRGVAACAVMFFHYTLFDSLYEKPTELHPIFYLGYYGVHLFFVISGFVISMTLDKTPALWTFVLMRGGRIFPAYWAAVSLTFSVLTMAPLPHNQPSIATYLINLTLLQKFIGVPHIDDVYWTLTVEVCFYAIMFAVYKSKQQLHLIRWCTGWLIFQLAAAILEHAHALTLPKSIKVATLFEFGHLFIAGILFSQSRLAGIKPLHLFLLSWCVAAQFYIPLRSFDWMPYRNFDGGIVAAIFVLFAFAIRSRMGFLTSKPLLFLGGISYTLYLLHYQIGVVLITALIATGLPRTAAIAITVGSVVFIALILSKIIERPALELVREKSKELFPVRRLKNIPPAGRGTGPATYNKRL